MINNSAVYGIEGICGDIVNITAGKSHLTLIHPPGHDFFEACRNKLGWSAALTKN